ncbi:MAG: Major Facilitator Superfamily transporter [Eubacterium sp.]|jgi:predicted MFS family arabinose efflux permease|nr:Major Facilitator Superfamily transporter [Eubacterium sp.]
MPEFAGGSAANFRHMLFAQTEAFVNISRIVKKIYFNGGSLTDTDMSLSRRISVFEGCTARSILTLTSGAFLVGFAKYLGANDEIAGIIAAIPVLTGIITAFSPAAFEKMRNRKLITCLFCLIGRLLLGLMIFIPLIRVEPSIKISLLIFAFLVSNLFLAFTIPASQTWLLAITPGDIRGAYFGRRESIVLGVVTCITLLMGQVLDRFQKTGQPFSGFLIIYIFVIAAAIVNFILFSSMKEPAYPQPVRKINIRNVMLLPLRNRKYMSIVFVMLIWNVGFQLAAPFTSVYMISRLELGYGYITLMLVLSSAASIVSVRFWGRLADKRSWMYLLKIMMLIQALCYVIWFMTDADTALVLLPIAHILGGAAISGINISISNIQYNFAPAENKTVYMGFSSAVNGMFGFSGTLAGSCFIKFTPGLVTSAGGFSIGSIQVIFVLAAAVLTAGIALAQVINKREINNS